VLIGFPPGSATLPVDSLAALKLLARQRGDRTISVTGYGEAAGSDATTQSTALPLAMARARAVATNLLAAGVPGSAIRINAEAQGNGAAARVIN
jgi:outer membrane protein OmpA-like peptidoglycan-associated protein